jgi:hypothetical protein
VRCRGRSRVVPLDRRPRLTAVVDTRRR